MNKKLLVVSLAVIISHGCATITSESMQSVTLTASSEAGEKVADAQCTLKNDKGTWKSESDGHVQVHRSAEDLLVECEKEGFANGFLRAISRAAGGMWGNIIFGGGVGALIDHNKGTGYDYPNDLPVVMGKSVVVDRKAEKEKLAAATE